MTPTPPAMVNALTIDVEDYFHPNAMDDAVSPREWDTLPPRVEGNTRRLLALLDEFGVRATFFVLGWVAQRSPSLVRAIAAAGHDVACHGFGHRLVYKLGPDAFRRDVRQGKRVIEDCLGAPIAAFRCASWSITAETMWALEILVEEGFSFDSSIFPIHHDLYGIPGFRRRPLRIGCRGGEIVEVPASTLRLFGYNWPVAGGGYLRLLPYPLTRWSVERLNERDHLPAIVYVHPWEFDPDLPRLRASRRARFRQHVNLGKTEVRLRRLLREFRFAPLREAIGPTAALDRVDIDALLPRAATTRVVGAGDSAQ